MSSYFVVTCDVQGKYDGILGRYETLAEAEDAASVCGAADFTITENLSTLSMDYLIELHNALSKEIVVNFESKQVAVQSVIAAWEVSKSRKTSAKRPAGRPKSELAGTISVTQKATSGQKTFHNTSLRKQCLTILIELGPVSLAEAVHTVGERLSISETQVRGLIQKLRAVGCVEIDQ